jgi:hypothetical protein
MSQLAGNQNSAVFSPENAALRYGAASSALAGKMVWPRME